MELTFLGTGTSQGVPMIACDCAVCMSPDPRDRRTRSSLYVQTPEACWVIDTGPEFRLQCLRENVRRVDAVVYTHLHTDHIIGFDDLRRFCEKGNTLPIYAGAQTMAALRRCFDWAFAKEVSPGYVRPEPHEIVEWRPFRIGATTLTPLPVEHGRADVFGYLLERGGKKRAAYLSDCKRMPAEAMERMRGVEILILDALRWREHPTHMNIPEALAAREALGAKATYFTHLCHEAGHAQTEAQLPPDVRLAYDGLRLIL